MPTLLQRLNPGAQVLISDPSWENHRALFESAGFAVAAYPYYDAARRGIDFEGMLAALKRAEAGTIVVLHACCHNPTGYDITPQQWAEVIEAIADGGLVPFLDMAYQGFGEGIAEDGAAVAMFMAAGLDFFVATSFSKSFSLYGERVGALSVVCKSKDEADRVLSQVKRLVRTNYSSPPTHGAQVVTTVLETPALRAMWEEELAGMRVRIKEMRVALQTKLQAGRHQRGHELHHAPERHIQLLGPEPGADAALAQPVRYLRHRFRAHLRRRAQFEEHRFDRRGHRPCEQLRDSVGSGRAKVTGQRTSPTW